MMFLIWSLLNIALFTLFIVLSFHATKLMRDKFGIIIAVIFAFCLLSFIARPHQNDLSPEVKNWKFTENENVLPNTTQSSQLQLRKTTISKFKLGFTYGRDSISNQLVPIQAYSTTTGFISGAEWIPEYIHLSITSIDGVFKYEVYGIIEWSLLGNRIYSQSQNYSGLQSMDLK
jgi:hypothetical protein